MTKRIFLSPPHMGTSELELVKEVFASNYIAPVGPMLVDFEQKAAEYLQIPYTLAVASGTAALHLILRHIGLEPGDVVLASTLTFIGGVSPVIFEGGELVFIDADPATWNMDPLRLEEAVVGCEKRGKVIKAVIATDLYGQCADMDRLKKICDSRNIPLIIDAAESLGATYKGFPAGHGAYASIYSFNGNKIITTSGGGMVASSDKSLIDHARKLSTQARDDFPYYHHTEIGFNYRMSNVLAGIGLGQLQVLDERVKRKREINSIYRELLGNVAGLSFMPQADYGESNCWLTVIELDPQLTGVSPEDVRLALENQNIESRPVWKPMHMQPVFSQAEAIGGKVAEQIFKRGLCLPSGTSLLDHDIKKVAGGITNEMQNRTCH